MEKITLLATGLALGYIAYQQYGNKECPSATTCPDCTHVKCLDCPKCPDCEQRPCQKCANVDYERIQQMISTISQSDTPSINIDYNRLQGMLDNLEFPKQEGIDYGKIKKMMDQSVTGIPKPQFNYERMQDMIDNKPVTKVDYKRLNNMLEKWRNNVPGIDYSKIPVTTVDYDRIQDFVNAIPQPDQPDGIDYQKIQQLINDAQFDYSKLPPATDYRRIQKMIDAKKVTPGINYDRLAGMLPSDIDYARMERIVKRHTPSESVTYDPSGEPMVFLYPERDFKGPRTVLRIGGGSIKVHSAVSGQGFVIVDGVKQANDVFHFKSAIVKNFQSNPNYRLVVIEQSNNGKQSCHTQFGDGQYKAMSSLLSKFGSIGTFATNVTHYLDIMSCSEFQRSTCRSGQGFNCL